MNERLKKILLGRLTPCPRKITFSDGDFVKLHDVKFLFCGPEAGAAEIAGSTLAQYWNIDNTL